MATYTMSQLGTPSGVHVGVQWNSGVVTISTTTTAASVVLLCEVPNGATILDWTFYTDQTTLGSGQVVDLGTSACVSGLAAGFSISASASAAGTLMANGTHKPKGTDDKLPVRVSLSDDQGIAQTVWLQAKLNAAPVTSASNAILRFSVLYTMDTNITPHKTVR